MVLTIILAGLAGLSLGLTLWQWVVARRFPLHQRTAERGFCPPVTVLKPLKGCDAETPACLRSWLRQEYAGPVQILFGAAHADDPVCGQVRELLADHPQVPAQLVICPESLGANAKVSTLIQLERQARHPVVMVSDADVRVPADLLANVVAPLAAERVGLVNCFYTLANPVTLAMRCEAVAVNADFWSQVLQSQSLKPLDFALGAVMAVRRAALEQIGGFTALADFLADDYQLGNHVARHGWRIALCPVVVECWEPPKGWGEVWAHQLRWARTIRVCQPLPYFFSLLSNGTLWPALLLAWCPGPATLLAACGCWLVRLLAAHDHQFRLTQSHKHLWHAPLVFGKDLLHVVIWAGAFLGNQVEWRGERYRVGAGGTLSRL